MLNINNNIFFAMLKRAYCLPPYYVYHYNRYSLAIYYSYDNKCIPI